MSRGSGKGSGTGDCREPLSRIRIKLCEVEEHHGLAQQNVLLRDALRIAANQLEGVSLAIEQHGQNINTAFFIVTYREFAEKARASERRMK